MELSIIIGQGAKRICYLHPEDATKCIKVVTSEKSRGMLKRELVSYKRVKPHLDSYIA